jgi:hypothetical protein
MGRIQVNGSLIMRLHDAALCVEGVYPYQEREQINNPHVCIRPSAPVRLSASFAIRGLGSAIGPLLAARALPLRCAASASANFYTGYA